MSVDCRCFFDQVAIALILALVYAPACAGEAATPPVEDSRTLEVLQTDTAVRYGIWGDKSATPVPTLFVLSGTIEETLGDPYYRQSGNLLAEEGYLCVSVDLPCHGLQLRSDEPNGLAGWRFRAERGEDFVAETVSRLNRVLDHLIQTGRTDARKVAACGTSRGGFIAIHFAARDDRVKCVAAFAPVTDLEVLREFKGLAQDPHVRPLALSRQADRLAGRPVWLIIGDQDRRVGTDNTISLARQITSASLAKKLSSQIELHVLPEPRGHTTPPGAAKQAEEWIRRQLEVR